MEELSKVVSGLYPYLDYKILTLESVFDLKNILMGDAVIVAPFDGKALKNPYYANG
jgi:hypothetical protein